MPPKGTPLQAKRIVCKANDYLILVEYLEEDGNYGKLFGSTKTIVGGKYLKREDSWSLATTELTFRGFTQTTGKNLYKKWTGYLGKYKEAKALELQTGCGLLEEEVTKGLTLAAKLNGIGNHFYKMDALVGKKPHIERPAETGLMGCECFVQDINKKQAKESDGLDDGGAGAAAELIVETPIGETPAFEETQRQDYEWMNSLEPEQDQNFEDEVQAGLKEPIVDDGEVAAGQKPLTTKEKIAVETKQKIIIAKQKVQEAKQKVLSSQKPTLVATFQESKALEATMREKAIEIKKEMRILEVQEMRLVCEEDSERKREELEAEYHWREEERTHARLQLLEERKFCWEMEGRQNRVEMNRNVTQIILAGWTEGKSSAKIKDFFTLLDPKNVHQS